MTEAEKLMMVGEPRRAYLAKLVSGFLFGLGFSIALVCVVLVADKVTQRESGRAATVWHKRFTPDARVAVESHSSRTTPYNFIVLGTVRDSGADSWDMVRLEVRLLDSKGSVVGICRGVLNGPVRPTQLRHFAVDCDGTEREPVPEHTDYEVEVVDASYEREDGE